MLSGSRRCYDDFFRDDFKSAFGRGSTFEHILDDFLEVVDDSAAFDVLGMTLDLVAFKMRTVKSGNGNAAVGFDKIINCPAIFTASVVDFLCCFRFGEVSGNYFDRDIILLAKFFCLLCQFFPIAANQNQVPAMFRMNPGQAGAKSAVFCVSLDALMISEKWDR